MKQEWKTPVLEVLDIKMTMAGPGKSIPDLIQGDPDETMHYS
ncbi:MAG: paeninodin family lasso peptide [Bacillus sp. (in: firmicutes)]